jgi:predicted dehydrogenase
MVRMSQFSDLGTAVIGSGFIGTVHVEALRRLGVSVRGLLGSNPERAADRARAIGVPKAYPSLEALLDDPAVQVVHVTSPNSCHYRQVKQILAAGRHVLCEKPLAVTSAQSAEDGHYEMLVGDAVARSAREGCWVDIVQP